MISETEIEILLTMIDTAASNAEKANNQSRLQILSSLHCILHYVLGHNCNAAKSFEVEIKRFLAAKDGKIPEHYIDMTNEAIEHNLKERMN